MADAFAEHLRRYNAAFGAALTSGATRGGISRSAVPRHTARPPKR